MKSEFSSFISTNEVRLENKKENLKEENKTNPLITFNNESMNYSDSKK